MLNSRDLLNIVGQGVHQLTAHGKYENGWGFKPSQEHAISEFDTFLQDEERSIEDRLTGYFSLPTGIGKTAAFGAMIAESMKAAKEKKEQFRTMIVVPTNQLVDQTKKSLEQVSPSLKGKVGLYDGRRKQLSKDVTVITYDSWIALLQEGKIGAADTDLLISDEAHRGTSLNRTEQFLQAYIHQRGEHATMCLAFTATDAFDTQKTVERTHKNKIAERTIKEAINDGELAEYAVVKRYIARIPPPADDETYTTEQKQKLREQYWTANYLKIMENEVDQMTGDPLYDNISAVYNYNTRHADNTAKALNESAVLQEVARKRGFKGVATSIHTNMSDSENKARMKDYLSGKYLFATGDSQFKEGLDYPAMKNGADVQRGSQVDKGQIVGRPARRWQNPDKGGRSEGMTFVEIMTYFGDDDPEKDKQYRDEMLENSVTASSVLEGTTVLANGAKIRDIVYENVSEDTLELIQNEAKRTGLLATDILQHIPQKGMPDGLNKRVVVTLLQGHHFAPMGSVDAMLQAYADQPDFTLKNDFGSGANDNNNEDEPELDTDVGIIIDAPSNVFDDDPDVEAYADLDNILILEAQQKALIAATEAEKERLAEYVEVTEEVLSQLQDYSKKTGLGGVAIYNKMGDPPDDLNLNITSHIVSGRARSALPSHISVILKTYEHVWQEMQKIRYEKPECISDHDANKIRELFQKTGLGGAIYNYINNPPEDLNRALAANIVSGKAKLAKPSHLSIILGTLNTVWQKMQAGEFEKIEHISTQDAKKLKELSDKTGLGGVAILSRINDPPEDLNRALAANIVSGKAKSAKPSHVSMILETLNNIWQEMQASNDQKTERISDQNAKRLKEFAEKTGMSGMIIFKHIDNPPDGLNANKTASIVSDNVKSTKSTKPIYLSAILNAYETVWQAMQADNKKYEKLEPVSAKDFKKMQSLCKNTGLIGSGAKAGLTGPELYAQMDNPPDDLNKNKILNIVTGRAKSAKPSHVSMILETLNNIWQEMQASNDQKTEHISDQNAKRLKEFAEKTGVGGKRLYNKHLDNPPDDLNESKAANIVRGVSKSAKPSHVLLMLEKYEQIWEGMQNGQDEKLEVVSTKDLQLLQEFSKKTGLGGGAIFKRMENPPNGLSASKSANILGGRAKSAKPSHLKAMFNAYMKVAQDIGVNDNQPATGNAQIVENKKLEM